MQRAKTWTRRKLHLTSKASGEIALSRSRVGSAALPNPNPDPPFRENGYIGESVDLKPGSATEETACVEDLPRPNVDPLTTTSKQNEVVEAVTDPESAKAGPVHEKTTTGDATVPRLKTLVTRKFHRTSKSNVPNVPKVSKTADVLPKPSPSPLGPYSQDFKDESLVDHDLYINDVHIEQFPNRPYYVHLCQRCGRCAVLFTYKDPKDIPLSEYEPQRSETDINSKIQRVFCKLCRTYYVLRHERLGLEAIIKVHAERLSKNQIAARGDPHSTEPQARLSRPLTEFEKSRHRITPQELKWDEDHGLWPKSAPPQPASINAPVGQTTHETRKNSPYASMPSPSKAANSISHACLAAHEKGPAPHNPPAALTGRPVAPTAAETRPTTSSPLINSAISPASPTASGTAPTSSHLVTSPSTLYLNDVSPYLHATLGDAVLVVGTKYYTYRCTRCSKTSINTIHFPYQSKKECPIRSDDTMLESKTRFAKCRACGFGYLLFYEVLSEEMVGKREDERKRMEKEGPLDAAISEWLRSEWLRGSARDREAWEYGGMGIWSPH